MVVVLAEIPLRDLESQCSRQSLTNVQSLWIPPADDVEKLEADLPRLHGQKSRLFCLTGTPLPDPAGYDRQYVGVVMGGKRWIYVNAFSGVSAMLTLGGVDPTRQLVRVCGGGAGLWGVLYDPSGRSFDQLAMNCSM